MFLINNNLKTNILLIFYKDKYETKPYLPQKCCIHICNLSEFHII